VLGSHIGLALACAATRGALGETVRGAERGARALRASAVCIFKARGGVFFFEVEKGAGGRGFDCGRAEQQLEQRERENF
jgi:hypothetical protein